MTNIGHFRAAGTILDGKSDSVANSATRLWIAPPTKMDAMMLNEEGYYAVLGKSRRAHGNAWLFAVHGQPGAGEERQHGGLHLDACYAALHQQKLLSPQRGCP